jgi:hypothetical protein
MKKWIFLLLALVLVINLAAMGTACKPKAPEKPAAEMKPAEAPAPAAPAATPAPPAPEATPKK